MTVLEGYLIYTVSLMLLMAILYLVVAYSQKVQEDSEHIRDTKLRREKNTREVNNRSNFGK